MFGSRTGANADKSRPGHLIITLLETKAVGRRRLRGGSHPAGIVNFRVTLECLKFEAFVTGTLISCFILSPMFRLSG